MKRKMQQETIRKKPSFFRLMLPVPGISKQLEFESLKTMNLILGKANPTRIYPAHPQILEKATFDRSGRAWPVKFHDNKRGVFVKDGWDRFFHDHSLGHFEFLVFMCDGKTRFCVKIFGKDGLEKVFPIEDDASNGLMSLEHCSDNDNKSVKEEVCDSPPRKEAMAVNGRRKRGKPRKNNVHKKGKAVPCLGSRELMQLVVMKSTNENIERQIIESSDKQLVLRFEDIGNDQVFQSNAKPDDKKRKRGRPTGSKNKMTEDQGLVCNRPEHSKKKSPNVEIKEEIIEVSDEESGFRSKKINRREVRDGIYAKNNGFCSRFQFFEKWIDLKNVNMPHMMLSSACLFINCNSFGFSSLKMSFQDKRITKTSESNLKVKYLMQRLPMTFAEKYLPKMHTKMVLTNEDGKSWTVNFVPKPSYQRFCGGWLHFMRDNELKLGDLCIFELINKNCMKVHISHSEKTK